MCITKGIAGSLQCRLLQQATQNGDKSSTGTSLVHTLAFKHWSGVADLTFSTAVASRALLLRMSLGSAVFASSDGMYSPNRCRGLEEGERDYKASSFHTAVRHTCTVVHKRFTHTELHCSLSDSVLSQCLFVPLTRVWYMYSLEPRVRS